MTPLERSTREYAAPGTPPISPQCPRCDYDLSGAIAAWDTDQRCDLAGTCPECGLTFDWGRLLNPVKILPRWSIEHGRLGVGAIAKSFWRGLFPWRMWRNGDGLRLDHPVVKKRLVLLALALLMVVYVVGGSIAGWLGYDHAASMAIMRISPRRGSPPILTGPSVNVPLATAQAALLPWTRFGTTSRGWWDEINIRMLIPMVLAWCALAPISFACLPDSLSRASVRWRHLLRAWAYSTTGVAAWIVLYLAVRAALMPLLYRLLGVPAWAPARRNLATLVDQWTREPWPVLIIAPWFILFWWLAISRYLRLAQPRAVTAAMMILSAMAAFTLGVVVAGRDAVWYFYF